MIIPSIKKTFIVYLASISILIIAMAIMPPGVFAETHSSRLNLTIPGGVLVVEKEGGQDTKTILVHDHLSSTKVIVNQNGEIEKLPSYYPYGNTVDQNSTQIEQTNRYYTAQRKVADESELYNYNARYYNPQSGIFIQPDSVEGPNRFAYVAGNPVMNNDPSGHFCIPCLIGIGALIGMMTSSPMASTPADTPGELVRVQQWEASGGPEFNYLMGRMIPGVGQGMGLAELSTGTDVLGREVGGFGQAFNVVDMLLTPGVMSSLDSLGGTVNTTLQTQRLGRLSGGKEILSARTTIELEESIRAIDPDITIARSLSRTDHGGGYQPLYNNLEYATDSPNAMRVLRHEATHWAQEQNGFPKLMRINGNLLRSSYNVDKTFKGQIPAVTRFTDGVGHNLRAIVADFDQEMMAYGVGQPGLLSRHIGGSIFSTGTPRAGVFVRDQIPRIYKNMPPIGAASRLHSKY